MCLHHIPPSQLPAVSPSIPLCAQRQAQKLLKELGVAQRNIGESAPIGGGLVSATAAAWEPGGGLVSATAAAWEPGGGGGSAGVNILAHTLDFGEGEVQWLDTDWAPPPRGGQCAAT